MRSPAIGVPVTDQEKRVARLLGQVPCDSSEPAVGRAFSAVAAHDQEIEPPLLEVGREHIGRTITGHDMGGAGGVASRLPAARARLRRAAAPTRPRKRPSGPRRSRRGWPRRRSALRLPPGGRRHGDPGPQRLAGVSGAVEAHQDPSEHFHLLPRGRTLGSEHQWLFHDRDDGKQYQQGYEHVGDVGVEAARLQPFGAPANHSHPARAGRYR